MSKVMEKRECTKQYKDKKEKVHFGSLRSLWHEKHSEFLLGSACTREEWFQG